MTTNNQQGMTDETIMEKIANVIADSPYWMPSVQDIKPNAIDFVNESRKLADQILSLISQHSASQEAEIKRLKEENELLTKHHVDFIKTADRNLSQVRADSQKRIEEVIEEVEPKINAYASYMRENVRQQILDWWQSLKKRVRGDGT